MDRFAAMTAFVTVVDRRGFAPAARQLGLSPSAVTRMVAALEERLATRLLQRTTRQVRTTLDGDGYYQRCVAILADMDEMESSFSQAAGQPRGRIKVDLSVSFGRLVMIPALPAFCERYPQIKLDVSVTDRQIDLIREGVDCVLRIGELRDSSLVARRLTLLDQVCCASADYIAAHGTPASLAELEHHRAVDYLSASTGKSVPFEFTLGSRIETRSLASTVAVNNGDAYVAACEAGFGLIQVPVYHVTRQLEAGTLVEVLPDFRPPPLPLTVLYPQNRHLSPRVRVFVDWLAELFGKP